MYIMTQVVITLYILLKMYCIIWDEQPSSNIKTFGAILVMITAGL